MCKPNQTTMNKPESYPDIIYKYRDWKDINHKNVLIENQLFLPSPSMFNDPFDCRIPIDYRYLDNEEKIVRFAHGFIDRHQDFIADSGLSYKEEFDKLVYDLTYDLEAFQAKHEDQLFAMQDIHYGVLSMSTEWNSILMWAHYADLHRGVCYGFWEEKLRTSELFGKGGPVAYNPNNTFPFISPFEDNIMIKGFIETHNKANEWNYENEYRLFNLLFPDIPSKEDRVKLIPDDFFAEIILGIKIHEEHKVEITRIAKNKGIKVYQAVKVPFEFKVGRIEI